MPSGLQVRSLAPRSGDNVTTNYFHAAVPNVTLKTMVRALEWAGGLFHVVKTSHTELCLLSQASALCLQHHVGYLLLGRKHPAMSLCVYCAAAWNRNTWFGELCPAWSRKILFGASPKGVCQVSSWRSPACENPSLPLVFTSTFKPLLPLRNFSW